MKFSESMEVHRATCKGGCPKGCYCPHTPTQPQPINTNPKENQK